MQELGILEAEAATIYLVTIICFCASRFLYTWMMKFFAPSRLLAFGASLSMICSLVVAFAAGTGWLMVVALVLVSFFMSLMFPTIYGIALGGVEDERVGGHAGDAKIGASGLIMAILGGALITPLQAVVSDTTNIYISYLVPAGCFAVVLAFAIFVICNEKILSDAGTGR